MRRSWSRTETRSPASVPEREKGYADLGYCPLIEPEPVDRKLEGSFSFGAVRILAIDDEPGLLRLYARALRAHEVVALAPEDALAHVAEDRAFDLVLCDLNLPRQAGLWFHECLADRAPELESRLVFCTGGGVDGDSHRILAAAGGRVVYKPFDGPELRALVEQFAETISCPPLSSSST